MRIVYFTRALTRHDHRFLTEFDAVGADVGYLVCHDRSTSSAPTFNRVVSLGTVDATNTASAVASLRKACRIFNPDVIVAGPLTDCAYIVACAGEPYPWVAQSWAFDVMWESASDPEARSRAVRALHSCDALFVDANAVRQLCEQFSGSTFDRTFTMPWGIDLARKPSASARETIRRMLGSEQRRIILHARAFEPVYDVAIVLEAFARARRRIDAVLVLCGEGSLRPQIEEFIRREHLEASVRMVGWLPEDHLAELLQIVHCYVSASRSDGSSVTLLQAMAAGVPVVVNDCGGNREWVDDNVNGRVVRTGDLAGLEQALVQLLELPAPALLQMAQANRSMVESRANWAQNFGEYMRFLAATASRER